MILCFKFSVILVKSVNIYYILIFLNLKLQVFHSHRIRVLVHYMDLLHSLQGI